MNTQLKPDIKVLTVKKEYPNLSMDELKKLKALVKQGKTEAEALELITHD